MTTDFLGRIHITLYELADYQFEEDKTIYVEAFKKDKETLHIEVLMHEGKYYRGYDVSRSDDGLCSAANTGSDYFTPQCFDTPKEAVKDALKAIEMHPLYSYMAQDALKFLKRGKLVQLSLFDN